MMSHSLGCRSGLKVAVGLALVWVGLGLGCAAKNARAPAGGKGVLVVVVALDLRDNTILRARALGPFAPDRPLGPGRSVGFVSDMWVHEHADGPNRSDDRDYEQWFLGAGLVVASAGEVVVDAQWKSVGKEMDTAETSLDLIPGTKAVLVMHEEGKPRLAVQFVVIEAVSPVGSPD